MMSGYIVNPWLVYAINMVGTIKFYIGVVVAVSLAYWLVVSLNYLDEWDEVKQNELKTKACKALWFSAIMILIIVLIPSAETIMYMIVAKYATFENVEFTFDALKTAVDYVVQSVGTMLGR